MGIYWNKDVTADGPDRPPRAKKPKPPSRTAPNVPKARTWTSPPSADEPAADQSAPGARNTRPGKR